MSATARPASDLAVFEAIAATAAKAGIPAGSETFTRMAELARTTAAALEAIARIRQHVVGANLVFYAAPSSAAAISYRAACLRGAKKIRSLAGPAQTERDAASEALEQLAKEIDRAGRSLRGVGTDLADSQVDGLRDIASKLRSREAGVWTAFDAAAEAVTTAGTTTAEGIAHGGEAA